MNYSTIQRYTPPSNEDVLIADVPAYNLNSSEKLSALFFVQQGQIVRSSLVSFTGQHANNGIILSLVRVPFVSVNNTLKRLVMGAARPPEWQASGGTGSGGGVVRLKTNGINIRAILMSAIK